MERIAAFARFDAAVERGMANRKSGNNVQQLREERLLSKAELARRAGVSVLTIDRVERGSSCRLDTKRKIILALGMKVTERSQVFSDVPVSSRVDKQD